MSGQAFNLRFRAAMAAFHATPSTSYPVLVPGVTGPGVWATYTAGNYPAAFAQQGSSGDTGYGNTIVAGWTMVPDQDVTGTLNVGVVAFKGPTAAQYAAGIKNAVAKVSFSLNGGPWTDVTTPRLNSETGVVEYTAQFRASSLQDGRVEIRAVAWPLTGYPRVLQGTISNQAYQYSMFLNANYGLSLPAPVMHVATTGSDTTGNGSLAAPYATVNKATDVLRVSMGGDIGGSTVKCAAGTYALNATATTSRLCANRWATITCEDGLGPTDVIFNDYAVARIQKIRLRNVKRTAILQNVTDPANTLYKFGSVWFDGLTFVSDRGRGTGPGSTDIQQDAPVAASRFQGGVYHTGGDYSNTQNGAINSLLVRGTNVHAISGDAFSISKVVLNVVASDMNPGLTGNHADFWQVGNQNTYYVNFILFGANVTSSYGPFFDDSTYNIDFAMVDLTMVTDNPGRIAVYFHCPIQHFFMLNLNITGPATNTFDSGSFAMAEISVVDSVFTHPFTGGAGAVTYLP